LVVFTAEFSIAYRRAPGALEVVTIDLSSITYKPPTAAPQFNL